MTALPLPDELELDDLIGQSITGWNLDYGLRMNISGGNSQCMLMACAFDIYHRHLKIYSESREVNTGPISKAMISLVRKKILNARILKNGELRFNLEDDYEIVFLPENDVEAWELRRPGYTWFSMPGGGWSGFEQDVGFLENLRARLNRAFR